MGGGDATGIEGSRQSRGRTAGPRELQRACRKKQGWKVGREEIIKEEGRGERQDIPNRS